jgi:uncharacterized membrane protein YhaH (DUF805 family)
VATPVTAVPSGTAQSRSRYWLVPIARAAVAAVAAVVITFSQDHSAALGLTVFGAFALLSALAVFAGSGSLTSDRVAQHTFVAQAFLAVPQGLDQQFTGPDGVERSLTASIVAVGVFGAYAAIVAVLLVIGGFSLKWGTDSSGRTAPETESHS